MRPDVNLPTTVTPGSASRLSDMVGKMAPKVPPAQPWIGGGLSSTAMGLAQKGTFRSGIIFALTKLGQGRHRNRLQGEMDWEMQPLRLE